MNIEEFRDFCLSFRGVTESFPFDENILVFKVMDKMFALVDVDKFESVNLKCDPERAITLREQFQGILPGWHMNKKHWNTVKFRSDVPEILLKELVAHSYELVVGKLPKRQQTELMS